MAGVTIIGSLTLDHQVMPDGHTRHQLGGVATYGGLTFQPNVKVSQGVSNATGGGATDFGDCLGVDFHANVMHVAWADNSNSTDDNPNGSGGAMDIYTANIDVTKAVQQAGQAAFRNPQNRFDVNDDGSISSIDALLIINELNIWLNCNH